MSTWIAVLGIGVIALAGGAGASQRGATQPTGTAGTDQGSCQALLERFQTMVTDMERGQARLERDWQR
ncbi:MAG: hypothetical protein AB7N65_11710 [Vicinamibacterales bacterium]